jgi:hypothetical protein
LNSGLEIAQHLTKNLEILRSGVPLEKYSEELQLRIDVLQFGRLAIVNWLFNN